MSEENIRFLRLVTGEDLISTVEEFEDEFGNVYYVLTNPMKIVYMMADKTLAMTLVSWVFHSVVEEQEFLLYEKDILTMACPGEKMTLYYEQCTQREEDSDEEIPESIDDTKSEPEVMSKVVDFLSSKKTLH